MTIIATTTTRPGAFGQASYGIAVVLPLGVGIILKGLMAHAA